MELSELIEKSRIDGVFLCEGMCLFIFYNPRKIILRAEASTKRVIGFDWTSFDFLARED